MYYNYCDCEFFIKYNGAFQCEHLILMNTCMCNTFIIDTFTTNTQFDIDTE